MTNFIVNLYKPAGITSHQAVTKVKRILGVKKAGHTGTLDPMATGVLLVCLNEATKVSRFLLDMDKRYRFGMKLGERTDTFDSEGRVIEKRDVPSIGEAELKAVVSEFKGQFMQKPPMYSAVKIGGQTLYKLARKGLEVERPKRKVEVYSIEILEVSLPRLELSVSCSKGTYIRTLCDDIGSALGTGAHIVSLVREGVGPFDIADSISLDGLIFDKEIIRGKAMFEEDAVPTASADRRRLEDSDVLCNKAYLWPIDRALSMLPEVVLPEEDYLKSTKGQQVMSSGINNLQGGTFVRLKGPSGNLFAIGRVLSPVITIERILHL